MKSYQQVGFRIICIFIILKLTEVVISASTDTLKQAHILYRHGDRGPIKFYPYDSYKDHYRNYWPEGLGQLTKKGKYMEYELGSWLRNRYKDFINRMYLPEEIRIFSTDVDRTLMSAECVLASFFYPNNKTMFDNLILWTPTPIHTTPSGDDKLLNVDEACPRIEDEDSKAEELPEVKKFVAEHSELFSYLTQKSGETISTVKEAGYLFDTLKIEKLYGLKLPKWAEEKYEDLEKVENFSFLLESFSTELKRLRGGPLVKYILDKMQTKVVNESERKFYMFSAHDSTVSVLLNTLGVFNNIAPPYAATVIIELHKIERNYVVKMFYQNDTSMSTSPHVLTLPGCTTDCPLDKWSSLLHHVVPGNWETECQQLIRSRDYYYLLLFSGLSFGFMLLFFWLFFTLVLIPFCKGSSCLVKRYSSGYEVL